MIIFQSFEFYRIELRNLRVKYVDTSECITDILVSSEIDSRAENNLNLIILVKINAF